MPLQRLLGGSIDLRVVVTSSHYFFVILSMKLIFFAVVQGIKPNAVLWGPPTFKRRIANSIRNTYIVYSRLCRKLIMVFAPYKIQMQHKNKNNFQWDQLI